MFVRQLSDKAFVFYPVDYTLSRESVLQLEQQYIMRQLPNVLNTDITGVRAPFPRANSRRRPVDWMAPMKDTVEARRKALLTSLTKLTPSPQPSYSIRTRLAPFITRTFMATIIECRPALMTVLDSSYDLPDKVNILFTVRQWGKESTARYLTWAQTAHDILMEMNITVWDAYTLRVPYGVHLDLMTYLRYHRLPARMCDYMSSVFTVVYCPEVTQRSLIHSPYAMLREHLSTQKLRYLATHRSEYLKQFCKCDQYADALKTSGHVCHWADSTMWPWHSGDSPSPLSRLFRLPSKTCIFDKDIKRLMTKLQEQFQLAVAGLELWCQDILDPNHCVTFMDCSDTEAYLNKTDIIRAWKPHRENLRVAPADKCDNRSVIMCTSFYLDKLLDSFLTETSILTAWLDRRERYMFATRRPLQAVIVKRRRLRLLLHETCKYRILPWMAEESALELMRNAYTCALQQIHNPPRVAAGGSLPKVKIHPKSKAITEKFRTLQSFYSTPTKRTDQMVAAILLSSELLLAASDPSWAMHVHRTSHFIDKFKALYEYAVGHFQTIHFCTSDVKEMFTQIRRQKARRAALYIVKSAMRITDTQLASRHADRYPQIQIDMATKSVCFTRCPDMSKTILDIQTFSDILDVILDTSYLNIGSLVAMQTEGL
eukprot:gene3968-4328_t